MRRLLISLCIGLMLSIKALMADVRLPRFFSDGMVLQRHQPISIWGWADGGEQIKVHLNNQQEETTADADGKWRLRLLPEEAGGPFQLVVSGKNTLSLSNVLIGEVWVCSGQSNMEWVVAKFNNAEREIANANYPQIRLLKIPKNMAGEPLDDVKGPITWHEATSKNVGHFSAVSYYFGRELYKKLNVPIGLINTSWGGTQIETWLSKEAMENDKNLRRAVPIFESVSADVIRRNKKPNRYPTLLFNAMVNPLIPFTVKGVIWYQGESNSRRAYEYRRLFPLMIKDWRKRWGLGDLPFYFVQLASYKAFGGTSATGSRWAELREAQHMTLSLPRTGEAITIDIGDTDNIHPGNKQDVGKRLAAIALHDSYDWELVYSGPVYKNYKISNGQAILHFDYVHSGLTTHGPEKVRGFEIAGPDKHFYPAEARIVGKTVVVSCPSVHNPKAIRYAWADDPGKSNLFNKEGFPAAPFRTDNWPSVTKDVIYELKK